MDLLCYSPVRWREEKERHSYINHWPPRLKVTVCLPGVAWHHRAVLVTSVLAWCSGVVPAVGFTGLTWDAVR